MKHKIKVLSIIISISLFILPTSSYAINFWLNPDNYDPDDDCGGITAGGTWLVDLVPLEVGSGDPNRITALDAMKKQYKIGDKGQTFCYDFGNSSLGGDILIDWYKAFDRHIETTCLHGAEIVLYYDANDKDPDPPHSTYKWISLFSEEGDSGSRQFHVDALEPGGVPEDKDPAYYTEKELENDSYWVPSGYIMSLDHDFIFSDGPSDPHLEITPWCGGITFYTFLTGYSDIYTQNGTDYQDIILYDALKWGYIGVCVPEPATIALLTLGSLALLRKHRT
jgi:hypothetical protein